MDKNDSISIKGENIEIETEKPNIISTHLNENKQLDTSFSTHQSKVDIFNHNSEKVDEQKKEIAHFSVLQPEYIKCEVTDMCKQIFEERVVDDKINDNDIKIDELTIKIEEPDISTYLNENRQSNVSLSSHQSKNKCNEDTFSHNSDKAGDWQKEITHFSVLYPQYIKCEVTNTYKQTCEQGALEDIGDDNDIKIEELGMKIEEPYILNENKLNESLNSQQSKVIDEIYKKDIFNHTCESADEWKKEITHFSGLYPKCSTSEVTDVYENTYEKNAFDDIDIKTEELGIKIDEPDIVSTYLKEDEKNWKNDEYLMIENVSNKKLMKSDKLTHTGQKTYKCDICEKCFKKPSYLSSHKLTHSDKKDYKCDVCNKEFTILRSLVQHKRVHTGEKPYKCDVCNKRCRTSSDLVKHRAVHTGEKPYRCDVCYKNFTQKNNLVSHKLTHTGEKPHECDVCNKRFTQVSHLIEHKRTHTGEKPFNCNVCKKACRTRSELRKHKIIHTGERPYKCDVCDKTFTQSGNLLSHKIIHTGEKMYKCDVCNLRCAYLSNLVSHKLTHTGERPYNCDVCNKRFTTSSTLSRHKLTHTGEKPFKCDMCKRGFSKTVYLIKHKLTHTDGKLIQEKPYSCDVCDKRFTKSSRLARHKLTHTGK